jgi:arylsulfatase A-like enzyme
MSDKPRFMRDRSLVSRRYIDRAQENTGQALMAVDEGVRKILKVAGPELSNTLVVFMSDNGFMWGEHRLTGKYEPYQWSTEVPLIMRWDGHFVPASQGGLGANVDVTTTMLDASGTPDSLGTEGVSLLSSHRRQIVLEAMEDGAHPAYCGVRTADELFVNYDGKGRVELYDYASDPLELNNVARETAYQTERQRLRSVTERLCNPTPPGFQWQ